MKFAIKHKTENDLALIVLVDNETGSEVSVLPSHGALLHAFTLQAKGSSFNIIDHYKSLQQLKDTLVTSYKSSKLSPFVCRIPNGQYHYEDSEYEFQKKFPDGSAIHGLLFNKAFEVTDELVTETWASVTMQYHYKKDDAGYPFDYTCFVKYKLKKDRLLQVETAVLNNSNEPIPIADGWHPYFTLNGKADDWELSFQSGQMLEFDEKLIPTGRLVTNKKFNVPEKIGNAFLDNCFLLDPFNGRPACSLKNPDNGYQLLFFPGEQYPYLQIYTPPHRESIAIENLSGAPNCFNNGMGLTILQPGHPQTFTLGYQLLAPAQ